MWNLSSRFNDWTAGRGVVNDGRKHAGVGVHVRGVTCLVLRFDVEHPLPLAFILRWVRGSWMGTVVGVGMERGVAQ
jgi:hypothetical protein